MDFTLDANIFDATISIRMGLMMLMRATRVTPAAILVAIPLVSSAVLVPLSLVEAMGVFALSSAQ